MPQHVQAKRCMDDYGARFPCREAVGLSLLDLLLKPFQLEHLPLQVRSRGRLIGYEARGRIHSLREPMVYDAEAWDTGTGTRANARHFPDKKRAIQAAVREVTERLKAAGIID